MTAQSIFSAAELEPQCIRVGECTQFVIRLTVGPGYTSNASRIIFDLPTTLGTSRPSFFHCEDDGFIQVYVNNPDVTFHKRIWDVENGEFADQARRSWRGMAQRMIVLDLSAGLVAGDNIKLHWGDTGGGFGAGTLVTRIVPIPNYAATIHVRYFDSQSKGLPDWGRSFKGYTRPMPDCELALQFRLEPREASHLRLIRQISSAALIPYDLFCNVAIVERLEDIVESTAPSERNSLGVFEFADKYVQVQSKGKSLTATPAMDNVCDGLNLYWGDVHTHSTFSKDCIEREKLQAQPADLMQYARDCARLDFFAVTDHHRPAETERHKIGAANWERTLDAIRAYDCPGHFLVFPGFEYQCQRGDTVLLCNWLPEYHEIDCPDWTDLRALWETWSGKDYLSIAHLHNPGELAVGEWWEHPDANVAPVLEIFSCHGSYERADVVENRPNFSQKTRADRWGEFFLRRGYRYGLVCNSDGHKGHVGLNGLTAIFARSLTKADILDAYRQRRLYGTTNARIRLIFKANGEWMGAVLKNMPTKQFTINVHGENRLKRIDLFRNAELYRRFYPSGLEFQDEIIVSDEKPANWYVRVTQMDNHQAFSSPIWFSEI